METKRDILFWNEEDRFFKSSVSFYMLYQRAVKAGESVMKSAGSPKGLYAGDSISLKRTIKAIREGVENIQSNIKQINHNLNWYAHRGMMPYDWADYFTQFWNVIEKENKNVLALLPASRNNDVSLHSANCAESGGEVPLGVRLPVMPPEEPGEGTPKPVAKNKPCIYDSRGEHFFDMLGKCVHCGEKKEEG